MSARHGECFEFVGGHTAVLCSSYRGVPELRGAASGVAER